MLSRETLISMLKNEYPSSYNSHDVDNMSVKELDDLLDYLDSMQNKASGGLMLDNTKTYHQANDYTAPPDLEIMLGYKKGGRINFSNGGSGNWFDNLEGQGKNIYDSMKAFGHDDNVIKETLISGGYYSPDGTPVETEQVTGIINQDIGGGGGGGISNLDLTFTEGAQPKTQATLQGDYDIQGNKINELGQTGLLGIRDKAIDFFSNLGTPKVRGTLGTRLSNQPRIPLPGALAAYSFSPFNEASKNYNPNLVDQLNFLELQDGLIGRDQGTGLLKYGDDSVLRGKNVISLAGTNDYEEMLNDYLTKMRSYKNRTAYQDNQIRKAELELAALAASQNKGGDSGTTITTTGSGDGGVSKFAGDSGRKAGTTGSWSPGGTYNAPSRPSRHHSMADGGLATMFTRRR